MHRHACHCGKEWNCNVDILPSREIVLFEFDGRSPPPTKYKRAVRCEDSFPSPCEDCAADIEAESEMEEREALDRRIHESLAKGSAYFRKSGNL